MYVLLFYYVFWMHPYNQKKFENWISIFVKNCPFIVIYIYLFHLIEIFHDFILCETHCILYTVLHKNIFIFKQFDYTKFKNSQLFCIFLFLPLKFSFYENKMRRKDKKRTLNS